jgi:excisionase family DNA binding protein
MVQAAKGKRGPPLEFLTVGQAAARLNVHPNTVRRWAEQGLLRAYRIGSRRDRRFPRQDVERFLEGNSPAYS